MKNIKPVLSISTVVGLLCALSASAFAYTMTATVKTATGQSYAAIPITAFHINRAPKPEKGDTWTDPIHQKSITGSIRFEIPVTAESEFLSNINNTFDIDVKCQKTSVNDLAPCHTYQIKKASIREITIEHKERQTAVGIHEDPAYDVIEVSIAYETNSEVNDNTSGVTVLDDWEAPV